MRCALALIAVTSFALPLVARRTRPWSRKARRSTKRSRRNARRATRSAAWATPRGPLDGVGSKLSAEQIKAWHRTPKEMTERVKAARKPFMPAYSKEKLSDADLDALTAYLVRLKKWGSRALTRPGPA